MFALGDMWHSSVRRVSGAVGEGTVLMDGADQYYALPAQYYAAHFRGMLCRQTSDRIREVGEDLNADGFLGHSRTVFCRIDNRAILHLSTDENGKCGGYHKPPPESYP